MNIDHLSYSTCKLINTKGIDYAIASKLDLVDVSYGKQADIGVMAHALVLGGDTDWVVSPYSDFRKKEAREWRDSQTAKIITEEDFEQITRIAEAIKRHPLAQQLLDRCELEQRLQAKINGIDFVGYADGISKDRTIIFDLKTTGQFDAFKGKWYAINQDYDLQASVYRLFGNKPKYYFIVAESVAPYRVQIFGTSEEFLESGDVKLDSAIREFLEFRQRDGDTDLDRIDFSLGEKNDLDLVTQLGDWS